MELLKRIGNGSVLIDTAPFIYFVWEKEPYTGLLTPFFDAVDTGKIRAMTTTLTCSEVLVVPCRQRNHRLIERYQTLLLETPGLSIVPFDLGLAKETAEVRAKYGLKTPDAIQWATALHYGIQFFLTNDREFCKFQSPEVLLLEHFIHPGK